MAARDVTFCRRDKRYGVSAEATGWQVVATLDICGVSGLTYTPTHGEFRDIVTTLTREMPYIQHCHFGAAIALRCLAIMGNQSPGDQEEILPGL